MSNEVAVRDERKSIIADMATRYGMEKEAFVATLKATVVPANCSNEQFAAFLLVAKEYNLNPILKEIYAFPSRGGIQPIVSIDGWMNLINSRPEMDGLEFIDDVDENGEMMITARIWRKDRSKPISATEYMSECQRETEPWTKWPRRMLRHKAAIQAARYAFGFSGIVDPDEFERFNSVAKISSAKASELPPMRPGKILHVPSAFEVGENVSPPSAPPASAIEEKVSENVADSTYAETVVEPETQSGASDDEPWLEKTIAAMQSAETKSALNMIWQNEVIPEWDSLDDRSEIEKAYNDAVGRFE